MYFVALVTDYDGTIAHDGVVPSATADALRRLKESGRKLILATGRELPDLQRIFAELGVFDLVVAENGALLYLPSSQEERPIAAAPDPGFIAELRRRRIEPLSIGRAIVATWKPNETQVLEAIRDLELDLQLSFNKGAVMVLPPGVNKAAGVAAALDALAISPNNAIGVGDAENDEGFLRLCGCSVAVANALPAVKKNADRVTKTTRGEGVTELIDALLASEADVFVGVRERHAVRIASDADSRPVTLDALAGGILLTGGSASGKSTFATTILERIAKAKFQFCILDPEGDYSEFEGAVGVGDAQVRPTAGQALELLAKPQTDICINLLALQLADRPPFFVDLLGKIANLRATTGHPHWLLIDEAHHMLPKGHRGLAQTLPQELPASLFVTVHPDAMSPEALRLVEMVFALGEGASEAIASFCRAIAEPVPEGAATAPTVGQALLWRRGAKGAPCLVSFERPKRELQRHKLKYAQGNLGEDKSFYFRGPEGKLNLRAQNLMLFLQLADGVDDDTWTHHLQRADYSAWIRDAIKDDELASEVAAVERNVALDARESRARIRAAVEARYTAPSTPM